MNNKIKSGVFCIVSKCKSSRRNSDLKFFRFPKNLVQAKEWLIACKIEPHSLIIDNLGKKLICSRHFDPNYIGKNRLLKDAMPTINLPSEEHQSTSRSPIPARYRDIKTYKSLKNKNVSVLDDDLDLTDLTNYPEPVSHSIFPSSDSFTCSSCIKSVRTVEQYRKLNNRLLTEKKTLRKLLKDKTNKIKTLTYKVFMYDKKVRRLLINTKKSFSSLLDEREDIELTAKSFIEMLAAPNKKVTYTPLQKQVAQALFYKSPATFFFMRNHLKFNLPSKTSILRWRPIKNLKPGINHNLVNGLKSSVQNLNVRERFVTLIFDEIKIRQNLSYNETHDEIQGFQDYGYVRIPSLAQSVCVFMVRGLFSKWKFVLNYYAAKTNISGSELKKMIYQNLDICTAAGLSVSAIICDQGSNNRKCFKSLNITKDTPYFFYGEQKIYALYDICHLVKSLRNNLLNGTKFLCPDGTVSWTIVEQLYSWEKNSTTKLCPKLSSKHLYPNTFEKMTVRYATQMFSKSVVAGIKTAIDLKVFENNELALSTSKCFAVIDQMFDCLNSKTMFNSNPYKCALTKDNTVSQTLRDALIYFSNTTYCGTKSLYCLDGLIQTLTAVLSLANDFFNNVSCEITYLLTNRLNQDPIENLFAQVRYKGGNNKNPSLQQFSHILSHIVSSKLQFQSNFSNCETDEDNFLLGQFDDTETTNADAAEQLDISESSEINICEIGQSLTITTTLEENAMKVSSTSNPEGHNDDGYETSNAATPNRQHNHDNAMLQRHEMSLQNTTENTDLYNFMEDSNFDQYHHHHHHHHNQNDMLHNEQTDMPSHLQTHHHHHHYHHHNHDHQMQPDMPHHHHIHHQQDISNTNIADTTKHNTDTVLIDTPTPPKKRGRKKKNTNEDTFTDGDPQNIGMIKSLVIKERKKHDRFNGMSEEEVTSRTLPDHLTNNMDIIIIGINPGLFAAYKGHHYAGPGNHFWKCLYLSGLTRDQMTAEDDYKLLDFGIGFTNMVSRPTKGSADLTRKEIKEGARLLLEKLKKFRPKIAVFNGKLIYEVFSGKKDFNFGRQPGTVEGTNTYMWVMPSSSARCAQLPRAADKVPFYAALKKFRDYLNGVITDLDETDVIVNEPIKYSSDDIATNDIDNNLPFNVNNSGNTQVKPEILRDEKSANCCEIMNLDNNSSNSGLTDLSDKNTNNVSHNNSNNNLLDYNNTNQNMMTFSYSTYTMDGESGSNNHHQLNNLLSNKKKRGRPKKDKNAISGAQNECHNKSNLLLIDSINKNHGVNPFRFGHHHHQHHTYTSCDIIKKKRGRPKKNKTIGENSGNINSSTNPNLEFNQNFFIPQSEHSHSIPDNGYANNNNTHNGSEINNTDNCSNSSMSIDSSKNCNKNGGSDVATKSLSGLESLVDQIPSISDDLRAGSGAGVGSILPIQHMDTTEQYNNSTNTQKCLYTQNYSKNQAQPNYLLSDPPTSSTSPHHNYNYVESQHIPVSVNPLYHHPHHHHHHHPSLPYGQQNYHHHHSQYTNIPPPPLHIPSTNYPLYGGSYHPPPQPPPSNYDHSFNNNQQHHQDVFGSGGGGGGRGGGGGGDKIPTSTNTTASNKSHQQSEMNAANFGDF